MSERATQAWPAGAAPLFDWLAVGWLCGADSIVGVTFFAEDAPEYFGNFSRAFIAMFRITIGSLDWWFEMFPSAQEEGLLAVGLSLFFMSYVVMRRGSGSFCWPAMRDECSARPPCARLNAAL